MTRHQWTDDNLYLAERRLRIVELIIFPIAFFAFGFGFAVALAVWG